jgi:twitching motility protein PilT
VLPGIPSMEDLGLPPVIRRLSEERRGLVLVTGPTGSGKTTTLAAMIDHINDTEARHIVTIEDPIEVLHPDKKSIINQREVGADTTDFLGALKRALRQDPDVILIGEMRDPETVWAALSAAETGHLVFSTLHTMGAVETITRIIDFFPPFQQQQVRMSVATSLKGVISQRLLERADHDGRVPAMEVMVSTGRVFDKIADASQTHELDEIIADGEFYGMQTFDQSLLHLYEQGVVNRRDALATATNTHDLRLKMDHLDLSRAQQDLEGQPTG